MTPPQPAELLSKKIMYLLPLTEVLFLNPAAIPSEDRIAELEAEVENYREKADRAEQWLHRVYTEIEDRFLRQDDGRRGAPQAVGAFTLRGAKPPTSTRSTGPGAPSRSQINFRHAVRVLAARLRFISVRTRLEPRATAMGV